MNNPGAFGRVVLVSGPEGLLAERAVAELVAAAVMADPTVPVSRLNGADLDRGGLAEATGGSLFASASVVVIENLSEVSPDLFDDIVGLATQRPSDLALALVHSGGAKGKALLDRVRKAGVDVVDCPSVKPWELPQFVVAETRRQRGRIDPTTAAVLVDSVGSDLRALAAAIGQLLSDTSEASITEATIRRYFGGRAEVTSFAVADDTLAGDLAGAWGKLRWATSTGVASVLVTSALAAGLRNLGKYLEVRGRQSDADLARVIGIPPWKLKDLHRQSREWSSAGVAKALQAVAITDAQVKGASGDPGFALEQMLMKVVACRGRA